MLTLTCGNIYRVHKKRWAPMLAFNQCNFSIEVNA
jgi:hypothetical protein